MRPITYIAAIVLLFISSTTYSQVQLGRQVIGSTGGFSSATNFTISATVGEAVIQTLTSGNYILTQGFHQSDDSSLDENDTLRFYTGITPNGDGKNDKWVIDDIENYPENRVQIFNRWGNEVWFGENYDNTTVVWEGLNNGGAELSTATYFYVVQLTEKVYKGWVELTR